MRLRTLLHAGSNNEILAQFQDYGLGTSHVKCVFGGYVSNGTRLREWLDERMATERAQQAEEEMRLVAANEHLENSEQHDN